MSLPFRWRSAAIVAIVAGWFVWTSALPEMRMFQTTFHIDKGNPKCLDIGGNGAEATPYCTMAHAATIANPGQTFLVHGPKHGDAPITFTRPGTLAQPITWRAVGSVALSRHVDVNDAAFTPSGLSPNVYQLPWTTASGKAWQTYFPDIVVDDDNQTYFILKDEDGPLVMTSVLTEAELIAHDGTYFRDAANQRMLVHPYGNVTPSNTTTDFVVAVGNALTVDTKANYQIFDGFTITYTTGTSAQILSSNNKLYNMHYVGQPLDIRGQTNYAENITINHGIWRQGPLWDWDQEGEGATGGFSFGTGHVMKNIHVFNSWNSTFNSEGTVGNTIDGGRFHGAPNHCTAAGNGNHTIRNVAWWNCQDYQWLYDPVGITMEHIVMPGGGIAMSAIEGNIGPITIRNSIFKGTVVFVRGDGAAAGLPYDGCAWEAGSLMEYNVIASDAVIERCDTQISYKIDEYVARCASGEFTGCMTIRNNIKVSPTAWKTVMVDGMWAGAPAVGGISLGPGPLGEQWNFQLVPGSPAINAGMVSGATTDLIGISRPQPVGGLYDIGAYEFTPGGDPAPTGKPIVAAPASVTTTITAPTSAATYDAGTSSTLTTLAGTSKSGRTITGCTWKNSLGGSGSTSGTPTSWTVPSIPLTVSTNNVITVTCTNDGGTTGADTITVTRSSGGGANDIYLASAAAGAADGSSCANARAYTYFNSAGNWGAGATQIKPGSIVHVCGTITVGAGGTAFTFQGSGTSGNPVTLKWETGAIVQSPVFATAYNASGGGGIDIRNRSWVVIDGGTNGILRNTANGSNRANHTESGGVSASFTSNAVIKNLSILDIYVSVSNGGSAGPIENASLEAVDVVSATNLVMRDMTITNCGWCIHVAWNNNDTGYEIFNTDFAEFGHAVAFKTNADATVDTCTAPCLKLYGNKFHDTTSWDYSPTCDGHQDGLHVFTGVGDEDRADGFYVYNNYFYGNWGTCPTGFVFVEGNAAGGGVTNSYWWNNVMIVGNATANTNGWFGLFDGPSGVQKVFNNTIICDQANDNTLAFGFLNLSGLTFQNNIVHNCGDPLALYTGVTVTSINRNLYGDVCANGGNCFHWNGGSFLGSFAAWKTACSCDANSIQDSTPNIDLATGALQSGSPALDVGQDLASTATGLLATLGSDTTLGNTRTTRTRPQGAAWDIGAYEGVGVAPAPAPEPVLAALRRMWRERETQGIDK